MSERFEILAQARGDAGTGASRRLRRTGLIPGIVYGGGKAPEMIALSHNDLLLNLEHEAFYSSLLDLKIDGEPTTVVLKDLQRHPAKPFIQHVDFQRTSQDEKLRMVVPIHFENEAICAGVKKRGKVSHNLTEIEVTCLPADLPEFIAVDMTNLEVGAVVHVSDLVLPPGVELTSAQEPGTPVVMVVAGFGGTGDATGDDAGEDESLD
ncbi:MAG: 50S ribosomal protein L25/general stress protein Ctc [Chromatiaceae bacterium]|nr:MAG: 50S ribosomal protein L25/general stress protein Ctc [Chromatiaceae bacterium]